MAPSCLIDSDDRCGPNQELLEYAEESERCVCVAGTGFDAATQSCVVCGENEMASPVGCVCVSGFARTGGAGPCLPSDAVLPTGQDEHCEAQEDCAGYEASFCDTLVSFTCLVPNCTVSPDSCSEGKDCCDISALGLGVSTLCIAQGLCQTP